MILRVFSPVITILFKCKAAGAPPQTPMAAGGRRIQVSLPVASPPPSPRNPGSFPAMQYQNLSVDSFSAVAARTRTIDFMHKVILLRVYLHKKKITCMCALCLKQTSYTWWKPNDIGRSYVQTGKMHRTFIFQIVWGSDRPDWICRVLMQTPLAMTKLRRSVKNERPGVIAIALILT